MSDSLTLACIQHCFISHLPLHTNMGICNITFWNKESLFVHQTSNFHHTFAEVSLLTRLKKENIINRQI